MIEPLWSRMFHQDSQTKRETWLTFSIQSHMESRLLKGETFSRYKMRSTEGFMTFNLARRLIDFLRHKNIIASFFGHLHRDMPRLFLGSDQGNVGIGFIQPSLLPGGSNPSFRRYTYCDRAVPAPCRSRFFPGRRQQFGNTEFYVLSCG